jgi:DNA-directed RNA polymerase II subunit RPB2
MLGDGHIMSNGTEYYVTSSIKLANDFQRLCLHAGWACNIMLNYEAEYTIGEKITSSIGAHRMTIIKTQTEPLVNKTNQLDKQLDKYTNFNGKVYCCTVPGDGVMYIRRNNITVFCSNSRHGQKGTIGILLPATDMPFTASGIQPDIIINPCCIPSRMTIGQLFECVFSKVAALRGEMIDATPFNNFDFTKIIDELKSQGFDEHGYEYLYCGMTGKKILSKIFIGPTFYLRLKHMVQDKIHSRATGPRQRLTRQPPEGRSRDGGLRFGEMERDAMISHGCSLFLKERLVDTSDIYTTWVCSKCGLIAQKIMDKDIWICNSCSKLPENQGDISYANKITLPYCMKLLIQELMAINILPRIRIKDDTFTANL